MIAAIYTGFMKKKLLHRMTVACSLFGVSILVLSCVQRQTSTEIFLKSLEEQYSAILKKPEDEQQSRGSLSALIQEARNDPQKAEDTYQKICDSYKKHSGNLDSYAQEVFEIYSKGSGKASISAEQAEAFQVLAGQTASEASSIYWPAVKKAGCSLK